MAEILTESFCERCGTRYTFEAVIPKKRRIGKLKVLSKGLKNYVLSDDASLDEALAEARSEEQRELSGGQLDAFHQTFQFCMSCRQYTCSNCWNETEGRCLSCAPLSIVGGQLRSPLDDLLSGGGMAPLVSPPAESDPAAAHAANGNGNGHTFLEEPLPPTGNDSSWPTIDLFRTAEGESLVQPAPAAGPDPLVESDAEAQPAPPAEAWIGAAPDALAEGELLPEAAGSAAADEPGVGAPDVEAQADFWTRPFTGYAPLPEPTNGHEPDGPRDTDGPAAAEPTRTVEPAAVELPGPVESPAPVRDAAAEARAGELAERTTRLLGRFRVAAPAGDPIPAPQPVAAQQPMPGSDAPVEPPVEALPEPAAEAPLAETTWSYIPPAASEPVAPDQAPVEPDVPVPEPVAAAMDRVEMPAWPTSVRPSGTDVAPVVPTPLVRSLPVQAPQWPAPLRPGIDPSAPPFWASGDAGRLAREADLWTASAQEVAGAPGQPAIQAGIQSCVSCGLSLSATARFCRRCGTRQG